MGMYQNTGIVLCCTHFHLNVLIRCFISSSRKSFTTASEYPLGVESKYIAPLRKCLVESVIKNWRAVAALPPTLKKIPVMPLGVRISESFMLVAFVVCL